MTARTHEAQPAARQVTRPQAQSAAPLPRVHLWMAMLSEQIRFCISSVWYSCSSVMVKVVRSEVSGLGFETPARQIFALFPNGQNEKKTISTRNRTWDSSHREHNTYHCAASSDVKQREHLHVIYKPHQRWTRLGWMRSRSWRVLKFFFLICNKKLKQVFLGHSNFKFVDLFSKFL
jgi:hypothetical protein